MSADSQQSVPIASVIIPCRDEEQFIAACLDSLIGNDYPKERLEILIVDGMSTDRTREIVMRYAQEHTSIRLLENPKGIIPAGMNIGIRNARGEVILKVDAHSTYAKDYISKCVRFLVESGADNVGGVLVTQPSANTAVAHAIASALAHPFGSGNSYFRVGSSEPRWADTAAFGCYRKDVFTRIGLYNEHLARSSDMDFNARLRKAGGKILLAPEIVAHYYPRSRLGEFFVRNLVDGFWALYPVRFGSRGVSLRHAVPLVSLLAGLICLALAPRSPAAIWILLALLGSYLVVSFGVSACIARREHRWSLVLLLPIVFGVRHLAYALGSLWGILRAVLSRSFWVNLRTAGRPREASL